MPPLALVGAGALVLALLHVLWLARFRWGYLTDWDEAGYISIALRDFEGFKDGPVAFVDAVGHAIGTQPPVVPISAMPLLAVFGRSVDVAQVTIPLFSMALVLATYGVARHLMAPRWAVLAAFTVGTAPVVSDYSRLFHFSVPATTFLTAALWALLSSNGLRQRRWVVIAGVALALMLTARTMTLAYLPGVAFGVGLPLLVATEDRRQRVKNFLVLWGVAIGIAAVWWVPVWSRVTTYLTGAGYGAEATTYGASHPILSADFWTTELRAVGNSLYLPLSATVVACFVVAAGVALTARRRWDLRRWLTSGAFLLAIVVLEGYLALTSTSNQGTAFPLPWLPALVVLAVAAAAAVPVRLVRMALAALFVAVIAVNLGMKNGVTTGLAAPRYAEIPVVGSVTVLNGRDFVYGALAGRGYAVPDPPNRLPALHKRWSTLNDQLVRFTTRFAEKRSREPSILVGTGDYLINDTRMRLSSELLYRHDLEVAVVTASPTVQGYRRDLEERQANFLITSDPPPGERRLENPRALVRAAVGLGFRDVRTLRAPDGRRVFIRWRDR